MALGWDLAAQAQLGSGLVRPAFLFRLATDPVVRLWAGAGDLAIGEDNIEDVDQAIYTGMGELLNPPEFDQLINGVAERVEFVLAGAAVDGTVAALASSAADSVRGCEVWLGFLAFDERFQILSPTAWLGQWTADSLKVNRVSEGGEVQRTISLSCGNAMTGRRKAANAYWSGPDQRRRSADDAFCDRAKVYNAGSTKSWPI